GELTIGSKNKKAGMLFIRFAVIPPAPAMVTNSAKLLALSGVSVPSQVATPVERTTAATADMTMTTSKEYQGTKSRVTSSLVRGMQESRTMMATMELLSQYGMGEASTGIKTPTTIAQIMSKRRC